MTTIWMHTHARSSQQRKREREGAKAENKKTEDGKTKRNSGGGENSHRRRKKKAAKIEKKIADLVARKDAMENEIAIACEKNDVHQLKEFKYLAHGAAKTDQSGGGGA